MWLQTTWVTAFILPFGVLPFPPSSLQNVQMKGLSVLFVKYMRFMHILCIRALIVSVLFVQCKCVCFHCYTIILIGKCLTWVPIAVITSMIVWSLVKTFVFAWNMFRCNHTLFFRVLTMTKSNKKLKSVHQFSWNVCKRNNFGTVKHLK